VIGSVFVVRRMTTIALVLATATVAMTVVLPAAAHAAGYDPSTDPYSMAALARNIGATAWWNAGFTGRGVDVAVIDTGVSPVDGLASGNVLDGPDLSVESQDPNLTHLDTNGHGTFMAGLIAGHDGTLTAPYSTAPATAYRGIAPDARIINVKVGDADGGVDVTQVIAAIDWVVQHAHDPGLNIRVISLSYGTNSNQTATLDPLAYAAEQAWKHGIVVIAAAGNTGYQRGNSAPGLADPAYDGYVIAAGGYDNRGTAVFNDDMVGNYSASSAGCGSCKNPDLVAIGSHLQGLRVPNSFIDINHPEGFVSDRYFRGSGTSQATAITAGAVALILQKYPNLTPDQVKRYLTVNAQKVPAYDSQAQGAGELNLALMATRTPTSYTQQHIAATGTGSLETARGQDHLTLDNLTLTGNQDIFGNPISPAALATAEASATTWNGGTWNNTTSTGSTWTGRSWTGTTWTGRSWTGSSWTGRSWTTNGWDGRSWTGRSWTGTSWSGSTWTGRSWSTGTWT
jgi:serine protease AprX